MKQLSRDEMKKVMGGDHPEWTSCRITCGNGIRYGCCADAEVICNGSGVIQCSCPASAQCDY